MQAAAAVYDVQLKVRAVRVVRAVVGICSTRGCLLWMLVGIACAEQLPKAGDGLTWVSAGLGIAAVLLCCAAAAPAGAC